MKHAKSYAREKAMKMLYQTHFNKNYEIETLKDPLAEKIVCEILDNEQTINGYITKYLKKWSILELNPVNLTILQVAIWEILYDETDNRIIISEALNLSQEYTDIKSKNFIHFVLDNVSKDSQKKVAMSKQLPLSPTSVNQYIKYLLENDNKLRKLYISGEASNVKYHTNGNIYFSIKDDNAAINCIMFKNYQQAMEEKIIEGDKIEIIGNIYAYTKMGQYSINVFKMRKMGQGDLYQKFLELKNKLQKEGYFDEKNKKPFPMFPKKIGVITSPTGAAVKDIITTIQRRYDLAKIVIIPTLVQGENAKHSIAENIRRANEIGDFDSLIVGRGGGSIEDLWAFNEIEVAQAIYNSKIPIISAVGHETDFTIADFVADKRAPTPTGAAEMITPNKEELLNSVRNNMNTIRRNLENLIKFNKEKLKSIRENQYFKNPLLNILTDFNFLEERFISQSKILDSEIKTLQSNIKMHLENSKNNILESINKNKKDLNHQKENLDNLNPLNILSKGYAVVQKENQYLKSVKNIKITDEITIKLLDGTLITEVKKIEQEKNN